MPTYQFKQTRSYLGDVFQGEADSLRERLNSFETAVVPDEEYITSEIGFSLVGALKQQKKQVLRKIHQDLCSIFRTVYGSTGTVPSVDKLGDIVEVAVVPHNKRFEGKTSGADFGLVLTFPTAVRKFGADLEVNNTTRGCIVQAKLVSIRRKTVKTSKFGRGIREFLNFGEFAFFGLYTFTIDPVSSVSCFQDVSFVALEDFCTESEKALRKDLDRLLENEAEGIRRWTLKQMFLGLHSDLGTTDQETIEKIVGFSKLPVLHIKFAFPPRWKPPPPAKSLRRLLSRRT